MSATGEDGSSVDKGIAASNRKIGPMSKRTVAAKNIESAVKAERRIKPEKRKLLKRREIDRLFDCCVVYGVR